VARATEYSDDQAAHALAMLEANGGNAKKTAALLGIPRTTLRQWAGRAKSSTARPKVVRAELVQDRSAEIATNLENLAAKSIGFADAKMETASYKDLLIGAGIAIEKVQLLRGKATSRSESLRIELVAGGSLQELAARTMSGTNPPPALGPGAGLVPGDNKQQPL
jgi:hypothetical protein